MGKSKRKNKGAILNSPEKESGEILNLPEKCIHMQVKSGTKMRNVLDYAFREFPKHNAILWTAAGEGIGKAISCVEIFKRQHPGLHQVTRMGSIESKKSLNQKENDEKVKIRYVAQINILLTREASHKNESGYQAPTDVKMFWNSKTGTSPVKSNGEFMSSIAEEFRATGSKVRQKRSRKEEQHINTPSKRNKKQDDNQ